MPITDMLRAVIPSRKARLGGRASYILTELGKQKAEQFSFAGSPSGEVLLYLDENGASSLREMADGTHMGIEKTRLCRAEGGRFSWSDSPLRRSLQDLASLA